MKRHLLDVNVLVALLWRRHAAHASARAWFEKPGHLLWATNTITQLGVLRLLTNPNVTHAAVSAEDALDIVTEATRDEGHEFWPLNRVPSSDLMPISARLHGHRQWTDAALLAQATQRGGVLVTFDAGVKQLAARESHDHVLVLTMTKPQTR